jgi:hypothetical protein
MTTDHAGQRRTLSGRSSRVRCFHDVEMSRVDDLFDRQAGGVTASSSINKVVEGRGIRRDPLENGRPADRVDFLLYIVSQGIG